jgi:hypothetical protein
MPSKKRITKQKAHSEGRVALDPTRMYVRHPSTVQEFLGDPHPLCVSEYDVYETHTRLQADKKEVEQGCLVSLLDAFLTAHRAGLYPPLWVLDRFARVFEEYYDHRGRFSLDRILRLSVKLFRKNALDQLHFLFAVDIFYLNIGLGLSLEKAAEMARIKMDCSPNAKNPLFKGLRMKYTAESLAQQYSRTWKKQFGIHRVYPGQVAHPSCALFNWRVYLDKFPPAAIDLLPAHIQKLYR